MKTPPLHVLTLAEALPEHIGNVQRVLDHLAGLCRQEEGCLRFDVYADATNPCQLNTVEVWADAAAHRRHLDSRHVALGILELMGKMKGLPEIRLLTPVSEFGA